MTTIRFCFTEKTTSNTIGTENTLEYVLANMLRDRGVDVSRLDDCRLKVVDAEFYDDSYKPVIPTMITGSSNKHIFTKIHNTIVSDEVSTKGRSVHSVYLKFPNGIPPKFIIIVDVTYTLF